MILKQFKEIFDEVQKSVGCHQRYLQKLMNLYKQTEYEEFCQVYLRFLTIIFNSEINKLNSYIERCLEFAVAFVVKLGESVDNGEDSHPFLTWIITEVLKFHSLNNVNLRYYSCRYVTLLLAGIGAEANLDNDLCDKIQDAMLESIQDSKSSIRQCAVTALLRLQEPLNAECPVIAAFIYCMQNDSVAEVRKEVVDKIAPNQVSIPKLLLRIRDCDSKVRLAAYIKLSAISPTILQIVDRHAILIHGFKENNKQVKKAFINVMLEKWFAVYNDNFLQFLTAIKLDADEKDMEITGVLEEKLMEVILKVRPLQDTINLLPINEDKVIPYEKLTHESIAYWSLLHNHLSKLEDMDEYLEAIIPDLTPFCNYIEGYIANFKSHNMGSLEYWQLLEHQFILRKLFEMTRRFDISDVTGRKNLQNLAINLLQMDVHLETFNIEILVNIMAQIFESADTLIEEVQQILLNIKSERDIECYVDVQPNKETINNRRLMLAELKVELNIASEEVEDAITAGDFKLAGEKETAYIALKEKLKAMESTEPEVTKVKKVVDYTNRICRYLDILNATLQLPCIVKLNAILLHCKDEYITKELNSKNMEIYRRAFKGIGLCSIHDRTVAEENLKMLVSPIVVYRLAATYDEAILLTSVKVITQIMCQYGPNMFTVDEGSSNTTLKRKNRRLYNLSDQNELDTPDFGTVSAEELLEIILDMLDDDCNVLQVNACMALVAILCNSILVSSSLLSRIILQLYNPLTEQQNPKIYKYFGAAILHFAKKDIAEDVLLKAAIPTLTTIAKAPKTSPLIDIDVDNLINFLCMLTSECKEHAIIDSHRCLANLLCNTIGNNPDNNKCLIIWTKMLIKLNIPINDVTALNELKLQVELLIQEMQDKYILQKLNKHLEKVCEELDSLKQREDAEKENNIITEENNEEGILLNEISQTEINETDPSAVQQNSSNVSNLAEKDKRSSKRIRNNDTESSPSPKKKKPNNVKSKSDDGQNHTTNCDENDVTESVENSTSVKNNRNERNNKSKHSGGNRSPEEKDPTINKSATDSPVSRRKNRNDRNHKSKPNDNNRSPEGNDSTANKSAANSTVLRRKNQHERNSRFNTTDSKSRDKSDKRNERNNKSKHSGDNKSLEEKDLTANKSATDSPVSRRKNRNDGNNKSKSNGNNKSPKENDSTANKSAANSTVLRRKNRHKRNSRFNINDSKSRDKSDSSISSSDNSVSSEESSFIHNRNLKSKSNSSRNFTNEESDSISSSPKLGSSSVEHNSDLRNNKPSTRNHISKSNQSSLISSPNTSVENSPVTRKRKLNTNHITSKSIDSSSTSSSDAENISISSPRMTPVFRRSIRKSMDMTSTPVQSTKQIEKSNVFKKPDNKKNHSTKTHITNSTNVVKNKDTVQNSNSTNKTKNNQHSHKSKTDKNRVLNQIDQNDTISSANNSYTSPRKSHRISNSNTNVTSSSTRIRNNNVIKSHNSKNPEKSPTIQTIESSAKKKNKIIITQMVIINSQKQVDKSNKTANTRNSPRLHTKRKRDKEDEIEASTQNMKKTKSNLSNRSKSSALNTTPVKKGNAKSTPKRPTARGKERYTKKKTKRK